MPPTHTPTPWKVKTDTDYPGEVQGIYTADEETRIVETDSGYYPPREADAAFIVRAVNYHEELVRTAKAVMEIYYDQQIENEWLHEPMSKLCDAIASAEQA